MGDEELIVQVVNRVLAAPEIQELLKKKKPNLLILLNNAPGLSELCRRIHQEWGSSYTIKILGSAAARRSQPELPAGVEWITLQDALHNYEWEKIILPACTANTLAKIALGIRDTPLCEMAAEAIIRGIPLEIHTGNLRFTSKTPVAYKRLFEQYLERLRSFGVIIKDSIEGSSCSEPVFYGQKCKDAECFSARDDSTAAKKPVIRWEHKLLTEKEAAELPSGSILEAVRGVIITPLAKDALKRKGIEIWREGVWRL